ncbi:transketolase [Herbaspirillum sp. Sphag1AN]|uniref:transketolase n=1 Tax=unclassified Herbaspirillum TaxID=2624150 RepID=UPI001620BAF2|nr:MULTISPECIES: transketolase [unclassified Herbaspirillum]MBB3213001.1 transketolase [Herbaspirillum sp. Sphag1AN]MBB3246198.1 transketolase [Herbaspirillum sp. Sphag64]
MTTDISELKNIASRIRGRIIATSHQTHTPHLGSCLSCVDILIAAYFSTLKIDPAKPSDPERDRFILSKGHGAAALFQVLALRGFYPEAMLESYGVDGGIFAEHPPTPDHLPGIEAATGSLGHGLPIGLGMALAGRIKQQEYDVTVLLGDGECNEGSVWEAAMMAAGQQVGNLLAIVDFNKWQATGRSEEVLALGPLVDKWRAFGWEASEVDGHDMNALTAVMGRKRSRVGKPIAVVAHTVKGKGVSFMEDDNNWHYRIPTADEVLAAYKELGVTA